MYDDNSFETEKNEFGHQPRKIMPRMEDSFDAMRGVRPLTPTAQQAFDRFTPSPQHPQPQMIQPSSRDI